MNKTPFVCTAVAIVIALGVWSVSHTISSAPTNQQVTNAPLLASDPILSKVLKSANRIRFSGKYAVANSVMDYPVGDLRGSEVQQTIQNFQSLPVPEDENELDIAGDWVRFEVYRNQEILLTGEFRIQGDGLEPSAIYDWYPGMPEPQSGSVIFVPLNPEASLGLRQLFWSETEHLKNLRHNPFVPDIKPNPPAKNSSARMQLYG